MVERQCCHLKNKPFIFSQCTHSCFVILQAIKNLSVRYFVKLTCLCLKFIIVCIVRYFEKMSKFVDAWFLWHFSSFIKKNLESLFCFEFLSSKIPEKQKVRGKFLTDHQISCFIFPELFDSGFFPVFLVHHALSPASRHDLKLLIVGNRRYFVFIFH